MENEKKPKKVKGPAWLILLGLGIAVVVGIPFFMFLRFIILSIPF